MAEPGSFHFLLGSDNQSDIETFRLVVNTIDLPALVSTSVLSFERALSEHQPMVILIDENFGRGCGVDICASLCDQAPDLYTIVLSESEDFAHAIEVIRSGASDYLVKPLTESSLKHRLKIAERAMRPHQKIRELESIVEAQHASEDDVIGQSASFQRVQERILRYAPIDAPVLMTGPSGTGKSMSAKLIHDASVRAHKPFLEVNCATLNEQLIDSELFGHVKGAFTGAERSKRGIFEAAHEGTVFLDEIAELPIGLQPKLLSVLQDGRVRRVGATESTLVDVRVIAATNRNLVSAVEDGSFRSDLYFRLNVLSLELPALKDRKSDIALLAQSILTSKCEEFDLKNKHLNASAVEMLKRHTWPGNIRELENILIQAIAMTDGDTIHVQNLPKSVFDIELTIPDSAPSDTSSFQHQGGVTLADIEAAYIDFVLQQTGQNKSKAADMLGIDRGTLYRKLKQRRDQS